MSGTVVNPFAEVEALLAAPPATGLFVVRVEEASPFEAAGLRTGDVVLRVGDDPVPDLAAYFAAMRPGSETGGERTLRVLRDGDERMLEVPAGARGAAVCAVRRGESAWRSVPDHDEPVDLGGLEDGTDIWLRSSFGEEPAGFEWIRVAYEQGRLSVEHVMRLGGAMGDQTWDYCTRGLTSHAARKGLPISRTAFFEGLAEKEQRVGDVAEGEDGVWRGVRRRGGEEEEVELAAGGPERITAYAAMLLPVTMPLRDGASLTFVAAGDGTAVPSGRGRVECLGRRPTEVAGEPVEAWCFAWRHYGTRPPDDDEHFYVSDDRRLLRVDWGPDYNGCWCEAMPKERIFATIPQHLRGAV